MESSRAATFTCVVGTTLVLSLSSLASAVDVDPECTLPPNAPDTAPLYTGYALAIGTGCRRYVYCREGTVANRLECPPGLLYGGGVAMGGICDRPEAVNCADETTMTPEVGVGGGIGGGGSSSSSRVAGGFCGANAADAMNTCGQPCEVDSDCCSSSHSCFPAGLSCAGIDYAGAGHYYCGSSWCAAAVGCAASCPGGTDDECPGDSKCFADVPCSDSGDSYVVSGGGQQMSNVVSQQAANSLGNDANASNQAGQQSGVASDQSTNFLTSNTSNVNTVANGVANPDNYFCGTSMDHAAQICEPCPGGTMSECGDDFTRGCFRNVLSCGTTGGDSANNDAANSASVAASPQTIESAQQTAAAAAQTQTTTNGGGGQAAPQSVPAPSPAARAWTNKPFAPSPHSNGKTVIGYYASWQWYDRNKFADPQNIDFTKYDRINYAFFQPDIHGNLYGTDEWADPQLLWGPYVYNGGGTTKCSWDLPLETGRKCNQHDTSKGIIELAHQVNVEVMPSIGGWTLSDNFPGIAASAAKRQNFARQCAELVRAYDFDGIDIDWEYPGYADHSGTPADTVNFTLFLQAVRDELDKLGNNRFGQPYGLTAALPCGPDKIAKIQVNQIKDILTELNLMSYDLHGAWDTLTGTNAPMFDQGWTDETPRWSVHGCVNNYVDLGVPLSQMNIGLPFYGRSFQSATGMKQLHGGVDDINYHLDEGSPQYFNIVNELPRMTTYRHENTQTQYAVFDNGGGLVSYDDPRAICDKVAYANERGMHGFLIWEISGDMIDGGGGTMKTPLTDAMNHKINNPDYPCSNLHDPSWALKDLYYRYAPDEPDSVDMTNYVPPSSSGSANDFNGAQTSNANAAANSNAAANEPPVDPWGGAGDCPPSHTGYYPLSECTRYVYCSNGIVEGGAQPCVPGTLFDVSIGVCTWADMAQCAR